MSQDSLIEFLEVDNFKSYPGKNKFGPLSRNLNVVIGPAGSGISRDIVDAIRFVMGEEASALCVEDLDQLTYEAYVGQQSTTGIITSVTVMFISSDHGLSRGKYTRVIAGPQQQSEYKIDDLVVSVQEYTDSLQELGISVAAKNFLILQGTVESIALKDPMELTEWFEEISGSKMLKDSYESLRDTVLGLEKEIKELSSLKQAKIREMKMSKNEVKQYKKLVEKKFELLLIRLFRKELKIQSLDEDIANKKAMFKEIVEKITTATEISCKLKEKLDSTLKKLTEVENQISRMEEIIVGKKSSLMMAKERVNFLEKKLSAANASLEKAEQIGQVCGDLIQSLEQELIFVDAEKRSYKSRLAAADSQMVQLADDQIEEFQNLKLQAQMQSDEYFWKLDSINCEENADQDEFDFQTYRQVDLMARISRGKTLGEEIGQRVEELTARILASENTFDEQNRLHKELKEDVDDSLKNRIPRLQSDLLNVIEQLDEVQADKHRETRRQEKLKLLERLKIYPASVYDRVVNLCHPVSDQYSIATHRLLQQYLDAIVVDTEATANVCLVHIKDYSFSPETFLPLDSLRAEPFNTCLRKIRKSEGVKLANDVLKFDDDAIGDQIAPFLTNNVVICDSAEDAKHVRDKMGEKCRVVIASNDGTSFHEYGIVSHGRPEFGHRAQSRDDKENNDVLVSELESSKENLMNELHETLKLAARKESEISIVDSQRKALAEHLRDIKYDRELLLGQIDDDLEKELRELREELEKVNSRIEEIKSRMRERDLEAQETKERLNEVEDSVFVDFCRRNGLSMSDIRRYEERHHSNWYRECMREQCELKIKKSTIANRLNFQRQMLALRESDVERWKRAVLDYEQELVGAKFAENKVAQDTEEYEDEIHHVRTVAAAQKREIDSMEADLGKVNSEIDQSRKEIPDLRKTVEVMLSEIKLDMTKWKRYQIFKQSEVEGVTIPLLLGNVEEIVEDFASFDILYDRLRRVVVDYCALSNELTDDDSPNLEKVREKESELAKTIDDLCASLRDEADVPGHGDDVARDVLLMSDEMEELQEKFVSAQRRAKEARENFERVKEERNIKFQNCFNSVLREINNVYEALYQNESAQVFLKPQNCVEPYLDGIDFSCATPDENPRQLHHLSGREQIMAALALLFAFHSNEPAPFLILDHIDDSLDDIKANKLATYIRHQRNQLQTVVISSKEVFYSQANYLIGLYSDVEEENTISKSLAINLDNYQ